MHHTDTFALMHALETRTRFGHTDTWHTAHTDTWHAAHFDTWHIAHTDTWHTGASGSTVARPLSPRRQPTPTPTAHGSRSRRACASRRSSGASSGLLSKTMGMVSARHQQISRGRGVGLSQQDPMPRQDPIPSDRDRIRIGWCACATGCRRTRWSGGQGGGRTMRSFRRDCRRNS